MAPYTAECERLVANQQGQYDHSHPGWEAIPENSLEGFVVIRGGTFISLTYFFSLSFIKKFMCSFWPPQGMQDLSTLTKNQPHAPGVEAQSLNH